MRTRDGSANEESHEAAACWILLFLRGENVRHGFLFHSTHASPLSLPLRLPPFIRPFFFRHAFHDDATFLLIHLLRDPPPPSSPSTSSFSRRVESPFLGRGRRRGSLSFVTSFEFVSCSNEDDHDYRFPFFLCTVRLMGGGIN